MSHLQAAVLMCHAPIVMPEIGGSRAMACRATTQAMGQAASLLAASGAATVVVVSPHLPRAHRTYGFASGSTLQGDFGPFGHPELGCRFSSDLEALGAMEKASPVPLAPVTGFGRDHGSLVPLWFLQQTGFQGRILAFGFPWAHHRLDHRRFGAALGRVMEDLDRPWALLASGDMSHALKEGGPAGFHPRAAEFDALVCTCVGEGRLGEVSRIPADLRQGAAEDVVDSLDLAVGVLGETLEAPRILSYEAPFGVGYLEAVLFAANAKALPRAPRP